MQTHVLATANSRLGLSSAKVLGNTWSSLNNISRVRNLSRTRSGPSDVPRRTTTRKEPNTGQNSSEGATSYHYATRPEALFQQSTRSTNLSGGQQKSYSTRQFSSRKASVTERHFIYQLLIETKDPLWRLLQVLGKSDVPQGVLYVALQNAHIPITQFNRWKDVLSSPNIDEALRLADKILRKPGSSNSSSIPHWVVLHLIASKIHTTSQAHGALLDLLDSHLKTVPEETHAPYLILAAYHLSKFTLLLPLRLMIERFLNTPVASALPEDIPVDPLGSNPNPRAPPPPALSFNLLLQALSTNPVRSVESANNVVALLKSMDSRQLRLTPSTYLYLLSDRFVNLQLTKYLQERMIHERVVPTVEHLEAFLRIFSREGAIHDAKKYLDIIHAVESQKGGAQEGENDPRFAANTLFLNAQDDRASAFGFLKSLVEETPVPLPPIKQPCKSSSSLGERTDQTPTSDGRVLEANTRDTLISESDLTDLETGLPSQAEAAPSSAPAQQVKLSYKPYRDIYDLTATLHVAAKDLSTPTHRLIGLFMDIQKYAATDDASTNPANKPTVATYTVLIRGLLLRRQYGKAVQYWERFLKTKLEVDEQILAAGIVALTRAGKHDVAFQALEKFCGPKEVLSPRRGLVKGANERQGETQVESLLGSSGDTKPADSTQPRQPHIQPSIHLINVFLAALLRVSRPDVVFRLWTHMEVLYGVLPNAQTLSILLQAARRGEGLDRLGAGGTEEGWKGIKDKLFGVKPEKRASISPFGSEKWRWIGGPFLLGGTNGKQQPTGDTQIATASRTKQETAKRRDIAVDDVLTVLGHPSKGSLRRYTHSMYHHQYTLPSPWQAREAAKGPATPSPLPLISPLAFTRKIFHQVLFANDYSRVLPNVTAPASYLRATYDADGTSAGSSASSSTLTQALSSLLPLPTPFRPKRWDLEESMTRDIWTKSGEVWFPSLVLTNANFLNYIALVGLCGDGDAGVAVRQSREEEVDNNSSRRDLDMKTYIETYFPQKDVDWSIAGPGEIPLVLARMRALGIQPSEATLALSLVLWGEISVGAPLVERFGSGRQKAVARTSSPPPLEPQPVDSDSSPPIQPQTPRSAPQPPPLYGEDGGAEYRRLVDWLRDWVGEDRLPHWRTLRKWQRIVGQMRANLEFGQGRWMREDGDDVGGGRGGKTQGGIFGSAFWEGEVGSGNSTSRVAATRMVRQRPPKC